MMHIYGNRSIIPNNYYFTFDKIYDEPPRDKGGDSVLIGRCVLALSDRTVWMKTVNGYICVAKLDNEGRLNRLEGYVLEEIDDIDNIDSKGTTYNGDGTYIVNYDVVSKGIKAVTDDASQDLIFGTPLPTTTYNNSKTKVPDNSTNAKFITPTAANKLPEDLKGLSYRFGTWPLIRGNVGIDYLTGSVFLLQQTSNNATGLKYKIIKTGELLKSVYESDLVIYFQKKDINGNFVKDENNQPIWEKTGDDLNTLSTRLSNIPAGSPDAEYPHYILGGTVEIYQIMTDITDDKKIFKTNPAKRAELKHFNKTFIRKGTFTYELSNDKNVANKYKTYYSYAGDNGIKKFISANWSANGSYERTFEWGLWEDTTEQYTGYLGDLDPYTEGQNLEKKFEEAKAPYNKYTKYYYKSGSNYYPIAPTEATFNERLNNNNVSTYYYVQTNANRNNLDSESTLVEAINRLDEIIGSHTRFTPDNISYLDNNRQVETVINGSLSESLNGDKRIYNIREINIMDALVHHDADIGTFEKDINFNKTYNFHFTKNDDNNRKTFIDRVSNNTSTSNNRTDLAEVWSITEVIRKLDDILGYHDRLGKTNLTEKQCPTSVNTTITDPDKKPKAATLTNPYNRPYNIPETNIIDGMVHHDADIGPIETDFADKKKTYNIDFADGSTNNAQNDKALDNTSNETTGTKTARAKVYSLTGAVRKLDDVIGNQGRLGVSGAEGPKATSSSDKRNSITNTGKRPYNIPETNVIDALVHHDADIGSIENLHAIGHDSSDGGTANTNNLEFTTENSQTLSANIKEKNIRSITEALIVLDNIIGGSKRLADTMLKPGTYSSVRRITNADPDANDQRPVAIPEDNVIDALLHHDADIGKIELLNYAPSATDNLNRTYNIKFTKSSTAPTLSQTNLSPVEIRSLTEGLVKLDRVLGSQSRLGKSSTINTQGSQSWSVTGSGGNGDIRAYNIPESNLVDAVIHNDADIGPIENASTGLKGLHNMAFSSTTNTTGTNTGLNETAQATINSLTAAIRKLDFALGGQSRLKKSSNVNTKGTLDVTGSGANGANATDKRPYNIQEANAIDAIIKLAADIGIFDKSLNNITFTTGTSATGSNALSLYDAIYILDKWLGKMSDTNNVTKPTISETLIDHEERIKEAEDLIGDKTQGFGDNNNELNQAKDLFTAVREVNTLLGEILGFNLEIINRQGNKINYGQNISSIIAALHEGKLDKNEFQHYIDLINQISQNMDILDLNMVELWDYVNKDSDHEMKLEWGSF